MSPPSSTDSPDPRSLVDLDCYPILDVEGAAGSRLVEACRAQIAWLGACELAGFMQPDATARIVAEAVALSSKAVYSKGKSPPYLEIPDPAWPDTRRFPMRSGTLLLFQGRYSIHRVTRIRGNTPRLVALLGYDTTPGSCASELLQQVRYGCVKRPASEQVV